MISFATEFPVNPVPDQAAFIAQVVSWLRGTTYSTVLDAHKPDLETDMAYLRSETGEELRLREFSPTDAFEAIGFRHDFPDTAGRLWRTETVLRRAASTGGQDLVRLRTQCIAQEAGARLDPPRKPYLIKAILQDGWGGQDHELLVSDKPHWLADDEQSLEIARAITSGNATYHLPVIYLSAIGSERWLLESVQIERLAYALGGIAHIVAEPNRAFSFRLRNLTANTNVYGGTIAIALPKRGIVRQFYLGLRMANEDDLFAALSSSAIGIRSNMPADGWDWTELQEQALRFQRERDKKRLSEKETTDLYQEEIDNLKDRIEQLESQINARAPEEAFDGDEGFFPPSLAKKLGPEIYLGEYSDRFRFAFRECSARADQIGLDPRTKFFLDTVASNIPNSPACAELIEDLKRATKDPKHVAAELKNLLRQHGYQEKSDNKHIRLEAKNGYGGLETVTVPKTPSDGRGLINLRKQIERTLGIGKLL